MKELGRRREGGRLGGEKEDDWEMGMGKVLELGKLVKRKRGGGEGGGKQVGKDGGGGGEGGREVGKQGVGKEVTVGGEMAQGKQGCEGGGSLQEEGGGEQGVGWMFGLVFWMSGLV